MLVVGKGAATQPGYTSTYVVPGCGGGSGMVLYHPNLEVGRFLGNKITVERPSGVMPERTQVTSFYKMGDGAFAHDISFNIYAGDATEVDGATTCQVFNDDAAYGSSGGGGTYHNRNQTVYYNYGGGGSRADGNNAQLGWQNGGDGTFGFGGSAGKNLGLSTGTKASKVIPVQSIFGGTARGGYPNVGTTYGCAGGGAGYGDGGGNQSGGLKGGYGAGAGYDGSQSAAVASDWIVCLYYHSTPLS